VACGSQFFGFRTLAVRPDRSILQSGAARGLILIGAVRVVEAGGAALFVLDGPGVECSRHCHKADRDDMPPGSIPAANLLRAGLSKSYLQLLQ